MMNIPFIFGWAIVVLPLVLARHRRLRGSSYMQPLFCPVATCTDYGCYTFGSLLETIKSVPEACSCPIGYFKVYTDNWSCVRRTARNYCSDYYKSGVAHPVPEDCTCPFGTFKSNTPPAISHWYPYLEPESYLLCPRYTCTTVFQPR